MDDTQRKITKIAREAAKFTVQTMKAEGIGTAEFDFIHLVRHKPGITQAEIRETLKIDKGAAARRAASLEAKGYLVRKPNPEDKRSQLLFATEKAEELKNSKANIEDDTVPVFYPERPKSFFRYAETGICLFYCHFYGTDLPFHQTSVCAPLRQQHQPQYETDVL